MDNEELLDYKMVDFVDVFEWNDGFVKLSDENIIDILSVDIKDNVQRTFENLAKIKDEYSLMPMEMSEVDLNFK